MKNNNRIIDLELLKQYRDFMTPDQLERYGDYLLRIEPGQPFHWLEIRTLQKKKQYFLMRFKVNRQATEIKKILSELNSATQQMQTLLDKSKESTGKFREIQGNFKQSDGGDFRTDRTQMAS